MRSNTTIVSWTEKLITVSSAVRNSASISSSINWPRIAATPITRITSWSMASTAQTP